MGQAGSGNFSLLQRLQSICNAEGLEVPARQPMPNESEAPSKPQPKGVMEYVFEIPNNQGPDSTWRIYDVSGSRGSRPVWTPYFEDADIIVFLAPISNFDRWLDGDPTTNRLEDSLKRFETICRDPQLANCTLVLFLTGIDVLQEKIKAGLRVGKL